MTKDQMPWLESPFDAHKAHKIHKRKKHKFTKHITHFKVDKNSSTGFELRYDDVTAGMLLLFIIATIVICILVSEGVDINKGIGAVISVLIVAMWIVSMIGSILYSGKAQFYHRLKIKKQH